MRLLSLTLLLGPASALAAPTPIPVVPLDDGHAVRQVLQVQGFELVEGAWRYDWLAGAPSIRRGHLVSLRVDPSFLVPRQVKNPVLYVGPVPLHVVRVDRTTGCVAGVLPGWIDPAAEPWYVGSWELPERVDAERGAAERAAALAHGLAPRPVTEIADWSQGDPPARLLQPDAIAASVHTLAEDCIHGAKESSEDRPL